MILDRNGRAIHLIKVTQIHISITLICVKGNRHSIAISVIDHNRTGIVRNVDMLDKCEYAGSCTRIIETIILDSPGPRVSKYGIRIGRRCVLILIGIRIPETS